MADKHDTTSTSDPHVNEMESTERMDGTWVQIESNGKPGAADGDAEKKKSDADDGYIVDSGIIYDESDWQDQPASDGSKDGSVVQDTTFVGRYIHKIQKMAVFLWVSMNLYTSGKLSLIILLLGYLAYFIGAMVHERLGTEGSVRLMAATILAIVVKSRVHWMRILGTLSVYFPGKDDPKVILARRAVRWTLYVVLLALMVWVLVDQGMKDTRNLRGVPGLFIMMLICLCFSSAPSDINWHTIYWSLGLQFICALFVLRLDFGHDMMEYIQERFNEYFDNTKVASKSLFGNSYRDHYLVFGALPILFFSNATLSLLYYVGAIQLIINSIGSFLQFVLDTSPVESTGVAAGIFLEGSTALLGLRPYLGRLTKSQLFLITTSIFSSLGGAYIGILVTLNVKVSDIIPAMLMSAPATFTICKLIMPEAGNPRKIDIHSSSNEEKEKNSNVLEVIQGAAISIISLVANIIAIIFVFYAFISWVNHTFVWFGDRVGVDNLTMELIFSYVLYPISWCMGVESDDIRRIGTLLGYRIGSTNLVAFTELKKMNENRDKFYNYMRMTNGTGTVTYHRDDIIIGNETLPLGFINDRSERIITYSLCGFSSIVSVGMNTSIITTLIPRRKAWLAKVFVVALVAGNLSNCMTGAFAGIFYYT